ncbi:hypothetical protein ES703_45909 [subsurface metagenome]
MKFDLEDGGHTIIFFYKDLHGVTHPFPVANANIVQGHGTEEDKELLDRILKEGVDALEDRAHVAFAGPPIPPYKIKCYCGHTINVGRDERGYYIEGADLIIFHPGEKPPAEERENG